MRSLFEYNAKSKRVLINCKEIQWATNPTNPFLKHTVQSLPKTPSSLLNFFFNILPPSAFSCPACVPVGWASFVSV